MSPIRKPRTEPRAIGIADCRHSRQLGKSSRNLGAITLPTTLADGVESNTGTYPYVLSELMFLMYLAFGPTGLYALYTCG